MSVTRITRFKSHDGMAAALAAFLRNVATKVLEAEGCISCKILKSRDLPGEFVCLEEWRDVADHQAAAKQIPPEMIAEAMVLLAEPPTGGYFSAE